MPHPHMPVPDYHTLVWIKVKILCFLLLYVLVALVLVSFVVPGVARFFTRWDAGKWTVLFGTYLMMTGFATTAVGEWRVDAALLQLRDREMPAEEREVVRRAHGLAHRIQGTLFTLLGAAFLVSGLGRLLGWWPPHEVFGSAAGRVALLVLINLPSMVGAAAMNAAAPGRPSGVPPWE